MINHYAPIKALSALILITVLSFSSKAAIYPFSGTYAGANEFPANASTATGTISGTYNDVTNTIYYTISFSGLSAGTTGAHFHAPASPGATASIIQGYTNFPLGVTSGTYNGFNVLTDQNETYLKNGLVYSNIHTSLIPSGEIRTQIILGTASTSTLSFSRTYSGLNEVPANNSAATGTVSGTYDPVTNRLFYGVSFTNLSAPATGAHFHGNAPPGSNTGILIGFTNFPNATSGTYAGTSVLTETQEAGLTGGLWYANIHNSLFPGGEIRVQIFFNEIAPPTAINCAPITVSNAAGLCSQTVNFATAASGTPAPTLSYRIGTTSITSPRTFPVGKTIVTATAVNGGGFLTCNFDVVVNDTEAPVMSAVTVSTNKLWPVNHKMNDITVNYSSTDNCGEPVSCALSVTSNEAVNGKGDGNTSDDWMVVDNHHIKLRAERSGKGTDRVYTITATCTDKYGNKSMKTATVTVPHDNRSTARMNTGEMETAAMTSALKLTVLNNPGNSQFTLNIQTNNTRDRMLVRVYDLYGRIAESKTNLQGSQLLKLNSSLRPGIYLVELTQGKNKTSTKLVVSK